MKVSFDESRTHSWSRLLLVLPMNLRDYSLEINICVRLINHLRLVGAELAFFFKCSLVSLINLKFYSGSFIQLIEVLISSFNATKIGETIEVLRSRHRETDAVSYLVTAINGAVVGIVGFRCCFFFVS